MQSKSQSPFKVSNMQYRNLGPTGLKISLIGFGNMINYKPENEEEDYKIFLTCISNGINFFDTSEYYAQGQSERSLGKFIKRSGVDRHDLVISTKIFTFGHDNINSFRTTNRKHVMEGINASLGRLGLEYVDIVFSHGFDEDCQMEEICRGFNQVIEEGKAFYWATSCWKAQHIFQAFAVCDRLGLHKPVAEQCQYNMLQRKEMEVEYQTLFDGYKYGTTIWSPLAGGFLTGKYLDQIPQDSRANTDSSFTKEVMKKFYVDPYNNEETKNAIRKIQQIAKELGCSLGQLAVAWAIKNKDVSTAITGARTHQQLLETLRAVEIYKILTADVESRISKILNTTPTPKMNWKTFSVGTPRRI